MHSRLKSRPFEVLGFPSNQFGNQEPGTANDIRSFVSNFGVEFPIMEKIDVNGKHTHPVYKCLKNGGDDISWNFFTKFVVSCDSERCTIHRYDGMVPPLDLETVITSLLDEKQNGITSLLDEKQG